MAAKRKPASEGKRAKKSLETDPGLGREKGLEKELKLATSELKKAKKEIAKLEKKLEAEAGKLRSATDRGKARDERISQRYESRLAEAEKRHAGLVRQLETKHSAELASVRSDLAEEYLREADTVRAESERLREEALREHTNALSVQQREHEQEIAIVKERASQAFLAQEQKYGRDMSRLRGEMERKVAAAVSEAEKRHRAEILGMVVQHNSEIQRLEGEKTAMATSLEGLKKRVEEHERRAAEAQAALGEPPPETAAGHGSGPGEIRAPADDAARQSEREPKAPSPLGESRRKKSKPPVASPAARDATSGKKTEPPPPLRDPSPPAVREPPAAKKKPTTGRTDAWRLDDDRITVEPPSDEGSDFWKKDPKKEP